MVKIRRKITMNRVFQVLFYALGFPLFVHLVMLSTSPIRANELSVYAWIGVIGAAALWVVAILVQLLSRAICKKSYMSRAVLASIIIAVITLVPIIGMDFVVKAEYDEIVDKYAEKGLKLDHYEQALGYFDEYAANTQAELEAFIKHYNLDTFESRNYGKNTDGSEVIYNEEDDAYYSINGMYADGYRFGYKQARKVMLDYYGIQKKFADEGKDVDVELQKALLELETDASSDWNKYQNGASAASFDMEGFEYITASTEYQDAYGEDGTATKYYITKERLDAILSVLGSELAANEDINDLLDALGTFGLDLGALGINPEELFTSELSLEQLVGLVNGLGLGGELMKLIDPSSTATEITADDVMDLLAQFSSYQSPTTYPQFYFLEDEDLKAYAYAEYYATVHGAKIGSKLAGNTVGLVSLDSAGNAPYSTDQVLKMFDRFDAYQELSPIYSLMALRGIMEKMAGVIVFTLIASYFFAKKADDEFKKLTVIAEGGRK